MQEIRAKLTPFHPLLKYLAAVLIGAFIWAMNSDEGYNADVTPLMLGVIGAAAALSLIAVTESYQVAAWRNGATKFDRAVSDIFFGMSIMVPVRLVNWTGTETLLLHVVVNLVAVVGVLFISQLIPRKALTAAVRDLYLGDDGLDRRFVWFLSLWPLICITIWLMAAFYPPDSGWNETHQLLFLVLLPALFLRLRARPGLGIANPRWSHAVGLVVLACALFVA